MNLQSCFVSEPIHFIVQDFKKRRNSYSQSDSLVNSIIFRLKYSNLVFHIYTHTHSVLYIPIYAGIGVLTLNCKKSSVFGQSGHTDGHTQALAVPVKDIFKGKLKMNVYGFLVLNY